MSTPPPDPIKLAELGSLGRGSAGGPTELSDTDRYLLERSKSWAATSLWLAVGGYALIAGLTAPWAIWMGRKARRVHARYPLFAYAYGRGMATAGIVLGWIAVAGWALFILLIVVLSTALGSTA